MTKPSIAYLDSSYILGILFREERYNAHQKRIKSLNHAVTSLFSQAEIMSSLKREAIEFDSFIQMADAIDWLLLGDRLDEELARVFAHGYLRGADAFHLATALWFVGDADTKDCAFLTLDKKQETVAKSLGFSTA